VLKSKLDQEKKKFEQEVSYKADCLKSKALDFND